LCLLCIKGSQNPIPLHPPPLRLLLPPLPPSHPTPSPSVFYRSTAPSPSDPHSRHACLRGPRPTPTTPARAPPTGGGSPHAFPLPSSSPSPPPLLAAAFSPGRTRAVIRRTPSSFPSPPASPPDLQNSDSLPPPPCSGVGPVLPQPDPSAAATAQARHVLLTPSQFKWRTSRASPPLCCCEPPEPLYPRVG
jgi:hypothetical protein